MRVYLYFLISLIFGVSTVFAEPEMKGTPSELIKYLKTPHDIVTLSAEAIHEVQADRAVAVISVITEDSSLKSSLVQNENLRKKIILKLRQSGIKADKITGTKFSSTPEFGLFGKKPSNYKVENVLKIIIGSEKEFQWVASVIDSHSNVFYRELKFEHEDKETHKLKALDKAFQNLYKKKALYEKQLGLRLVPKTFTDGSVPMQEPVQGMRISKARYAESSISESSSGSPVFGELVYNARIRVSFTVKKGK